MPSRKPKMCNYDERDYDLVYTPAETRIDTYSLGELLNDLNNGRIVDDLSMQRDADQWSLKDKSMLVHTVLANLSILPISLIQKGTGSGVIKVLSDGKQRLSNFDQYKNNEFALSAVTPHVTMRRVVKKPKLDENGKEVRELIEGKKRVVMEPCVDENGKVITEEFEYKIAGKYYNELPDALKDQFNRYKNMPQYVHINYSPEEIQMQMLRDNTSVKMTPAQIGAVLCGEELAEWQRSFRQHDLFLNYSTWTDKQENRSLIERCVIESFVLSVLDGAWSQKYYKNVELFKENASKNVLGSFKDLLDDFVTVIKQYPTLKNYLNKDNIHIVIAAYRNFCDMDIKYDKDNFGKFLYKWFTEIKDTTDYEVEGNVGSKQKTTVIKKLSIINSECEKFMLSNGEQIDTVNEPRFYISDKGFEIKDEYNKALNEFIKEFINIDLPFSQKETALKSLIYFTDYPKSRFDKENLAEFEEWINSNGLSEDSYYDCLLFAEILKEKIESSNTCEKFSANDIPILIQIVKEYDDDIDTAVFNSWFKNVENNYNVEMGGDSAAILDKYSYFKNSLNKFIPYKGGN